jgi:hypothetical protein
LPVPVPAPYSRLALEGRRMTRLLVGLLLGLAVSASWAEDANPYFHAIHCKAVWSELTEAEKARVAGTDAALAAINKVLDGYIASHQKSARDIDTDVSDLKAYSNFEAHHLKDWKECVAFYAPQ